MTWLALCDFRNPVFDRSGLTPGANGQVAPGELPADLPVGTFVIEARMELPSTGAQVLLDHRSEGLAFRVALSDENGVEVSLTSQGKSGAFRASLSAEGREDVVRITYSWDAPKSWGLLSVENLETGTLHQTELDAPPSILLADIEAMSMAPQGRNEDDLVNFFGFSAGIEPVGLVACLAPYAPVETPEGPVMIDQLSPGDLVTTEDHGPQPVRWVGAREVPARGQFQPIRLRAPYFGLSSDLLVAPEQCLLIGGAEVEYLFGEEEVLVQARHLTNGISAIWENSGPTVRLFHVLLDKHEVISIAGCQLESLYVGSLGCDAALLQTTMLKGIAPEAVPLHLESARPVLRNYEAITLQSVLSG